ncbi:phosphoprotein [Sprivivirus cyprinus]|uniref:Phosphoprotein n=1 Tax=Spring viremia of carp virus TaxID=696863 RepID=Q91DS5_SVCV|nr:phosphoprotein [Sprivivirus cyprinus]AAK60422.1 phosphoprotein [Sprivivirus cyprinus]
MSLHSKLSESLKAYADLDKTVKEIEEQVSSMEEPVPKTVKYVTFEEDLSEEEWESDSGDDDEDSIDDSLIPDYLRESSSITVDEDEEDQKEDREEHLPTVSWEEEPTGIDIGFGPGIVMPSVSNHEGGTYVRYNGLGGIDPNCKDLISKMMRSLIGQIGNKYGYDIDLFDYQGDFLEVFLPHKPSKEDVRPDIRIGKKNEEGTSKQVSKPREKEKIVLKTGDECGRFPMNKEAKKREPEGLWEVMKVLSVQFDPWKEDEPPLSLTIRDLFISESEFRLHCNHSQTEREMALVGIKLRRLYNKLYQKYRL